MLFFLWSLVCPIFLPSGGTFLHSSSCRLPARFFLSSGWLAATFFLFFFFLACKFVGGWCVWWWCLFILILFISSYCCNINQHTLLNKTTNFISGKQWSTAAAQQQADGWKLPVVSFRVLVLGIEVVSIYNINSVCVFFLFFFSSHLSSSPFFSLSFLRSRNSDPESHSRLFPPTHYGSCLAFFFARRFQLFFPSSTRVELFLPTLGALSSS